MVPGEIGAVYVPGFRPETGDSGPDMRDAARQVRISVIRARISEGDTGGAAKGNARDYGGERVMSGEF